MKKAIIFILAGGFGVVPMFVIYFVITLILLTVTQDDTSAWPWKASLCFAGFNVASFFAFLLNAPKMPTKK